ncbi:MAG: NAD-dependent epimerase/dehydratase family protein [Hyphomicrobiales bacterium]
MRVAITGVAGFIGYHLSGRLLAQGHSVAGLDNLSPYYDVELKKARLTELERAFGLKSYICDIADAGALDRFLAEAEAEIVVHLAAQAGVRYSLTNPHAYVASNLAGFANVLEACRKHRPRHLLYASSSSVYGNAARLPSRETDRTDEPLSFYAATKRANEGMAYSYAHLFDLPVTGLRFFTVYGEWGRPDMAFFRFAEAILSGRPITIYNDGRMSRDFTYVGDAVEAIERLFDLPPVRSDEAAAHRIVNIASGRRVPLFEFIAELESALGREADKRFEDKHAADVTETWGDISLLTELTGLKPQTNVREGVARFSDWFKSWHARNAEAR